MGQTYEFMYTFNEIRCIRCGSGEGPFSESDKGPVCEDCELKEKLMAAAKRRRRIVKAEGWNIGEFVYCFSEDDLQNAVKELKEIGVETERDPSQRGFVLKVTEVNDV